MTNKAYIVANEQQECEVLEKLEREGLVWFDGGEKPTEWIPSQKGTKGAEFPYVLLDDGETSWKYLKDLSDEEIVFDGRKEEKMSDKYVVTQEFMNELEDLKDKKELNLFFINTRDIASYTEEVKSWWTEKSIDAIETNNRLIAIIRWVNGEDIFEVEKPKKWIVRSKECDEGGNYQYIKVGNFNMSFNRYEFENATKFDTKEEAQSWANSHQEVVEVEE